MQLIMAAGRGIVARLPTPSQHFVERGQFTRAEAHKLASLSVEQKPQSAGELPRAARLEVDLAIGVRYSRVGMRTDSLLALRVCSWGVRERMRGARVSVVWTYGEGV